MTEREYRLVALGAADQTFLDELLYHAVYVAPGQAPPPREILDDPSLSRYVAGYGREGDVGYKAVDRESGEAVGAVWVRVFSAEAPGYGFVDASVPELSIALMPGWRGRGIGTALMKRLLAGPAGESSISLSVSEGKPAQRLYERMGFVVMKKEGSSLTMMRSGRRERLGEDA